MARGACAIEGCGRAHYARGWCAVHYFRWRHHGHPLKGSQPGGAPERCCEVAGCEKPAGGDGLCRAHRRKLKLYGDPLAPSRSTGKPRTPLAQRLWSRVDSSGGSDACWPWTGHARHNFGYGNIGDENGRNENTHRVAWRLTNGPIAKGMCVLHACDNPACCNPAHLFLGTQAQNLADMTAKGRRLSTNRVKGERNWASKLTAEDVREIRRLRAEGLGPTEIAARFGVTRSAVKAVVARRTWAHVE